MSLIRLSDALMTVHVWQEPMGCCNHTASSCFVMLAVIVITKSLVVLHGGFKFWGKLRTLWGVIVTAVWARVCITVKVVWIFTCHIYSRVLTRLHCKVLVIVS